MQTDGEPEKGIPEALYLSAVRTAYAASVFTLAAAALMLYGYLCAGRLQPSETPEYVRLKDELKVKHADEHLKERIRELDRVLRNRFIGQHDFVAIGRFVLVGNLVLLFAALKTARAVRRKAPAPGKATLNLWEHEEKAKYHARTAVFVAVIVLVASVIVVHALFGSTEEQGPMPRAPCPAPEESGGNWPHLRGPDGSGTCFENDLPFEWNGASGFVGR